ncbi:MAG: hypothetical protein PUJ51_11980 [Clostridiales bacterium]|uniref:hypothetical protein n=1 Tax=Terrisporobacter sp. TaxID=1965305 RepID=UPI002A545613|nr:hypothetical protein [Terrisporobacter sp.]MDD7755203.1 hypothetical protein [Clostridiales bacterium]MDY4134200.1 hypothetical protein [Terrisporobacter sp.]
MDSVSKIMVLEEKVKNLESNKKLRNNLGVIISLVGLIITIVLNWGNLSDIRTNKKCKNFIENYSKAYTEVVNNYINGNNDSSALDNYIADTESGRQFKNEIIENINKNKKRGVYDEGLKYKYTFNYSHYVSIKETKYSDLIFVSGVTTETSDGSKPISDSSSRAYEIIIDKNNIKIENRIYSKKNTENYLKWLC